MPAKQTVSPTEAKPISPHPIFHTPEPGDAAHCCLLCLAPLCTSLVSSPFFPRYCCFSPSSLPFFRVSPCMFQWNTSLKQGYELIYSGYSGFFFFFWRQLASDSHPIRGMPSKHCLLPSRQMKTSAAHSSSLLPARVSTADVLCPHLTEKCVAQKGRVALKSVTIALHPFWCPKVGSHISDPGGINYGS